jgi:hypothetical protein
MKLNATLLAALGAAVALMMPSLARAYSYSSDIAYSTSSITLIGYAHTWKDSSDWDYTIDCIAWNYGDEGVYCSTIMEQITFAAVNTDIYRLSEGSPVYSGFHRDTESASAGTTISYPPGDNWTVQGEHYAETHWWYYFCGPYNFCNGPAYGGFYPVHLDTTVDQEYVCGEPTVDELVREYENALYLVSIRPDCDDFAASGGTAHFTWTELNGLFANGNPHPPWGMVTQGLKYGLETIYANYASFSGIQLTSGYRCPHGNVAAGGVPDSFHVHGRAGDLLRPGWTQTEFDTVRNIAIAAGAVETLPYSQYSDHHLHVAF